MNKVVHKAFFAWNIEKEEKWLNSMAEKGWCLTKAENFAYTFEECQPGEYEIRIDILKKDMKRSEIKNYAEFMNGAGAIFINELGQKAYLRKKNDGVPFELYSDKPSLINYYTRIIKMFKFNMILDIILAALWLLTLLFSVFGQNGFIDIIGDLIICALFTAVSIGWIIGYCRINKKRKMLVDEQDVFESRD